MKLQHFIDIKQLTKTNIETLFAAANHFLQDFVTRNRVTNTLEGKLIANLFFEPSTRTCNSFTIAAKRLGALTISPNMQNSSLQKGESLLDTIQTIESMGADTFVIRHHENGLMRWLVEHLTSSCHIINAGEGWLQHPTQTLLDLMTIQQFHNDWQQLRVAIIGDLRHSRVANSLIDGLDIMQAKEIRLISPDVLKPTRELTSACIFTNDINAGIADADVIVCLRLQKERMDTEHTINESEFQQNYCVTNALLQNAQPNVIVMHPGPMNRNIEITSEVADGPHSVILRQVTNGVAMRMAVLHALLGSKK